MGDSRRIWLRRFRHPEKSRMMMVLHDAATGLDFGEPALYPEEFAEMLQQLNTLRAKHREQINPLIFKDRFPPYDPPR